MELSMCGAAAFCGLSLWRPNLFMQKAARAEDAQFEFMWNAVTPRVFCISILSDVKLEKQEKIPSVKLVFAAITYVNSSLSGTNLVKKAIFAMVEGDCDEVSANICFSLEAF